MVIISTRAVLVSIQAVSPVSTLASAAGVCCATAGTASSRHTNRVGNSPRRSLVISECLVIGFAGADAHGPLQVDDEHLAVADLAGVGGADDGLDHLLGHVRAD